MKKTILTSALIALSAAGLAGAAFADDDDCYAPMAQWQPRDAARDWARKQGWEVRRLRIDDGCYEIEGYDRSGREIEVKIDPSSFAIVEFEYEDDDDDDDDGYRGRRKNAPPAGPVAPADPPDNGLFAPGSKPGVVVK